MRLVLFLLLAPTVATVIVSGVTAGNPLAEGLAVGFMMPVSLLVVLASRRPKPLPRKADPAKIARMERELGMEPSMTTEERHAANRAEADRQGRRETLETLADGVDREALTTVAKPCRTCGADAGEPCRDRRHRRTVYKPAPQTPEWSVYARPATFHGAPTFGHGIEGS